MIISVLFIIALTYAKVDARLNDAKSNTDKIVFKTSADFDDVTNEDVMHFKRSYALFDSVDLQFQELNNKTLSYKGKRYKVGEINTPLDIFADSATYMHNGIPADRPKSNIYQQETTEEIITVVKDLQQEIQSVTIINKVTNEIAELSTISSGTFAIVKESDYNYDDINAKFTYGSHSESNVELKLFNIMRNQIQASSATCSSYTALEIAIAYESSFCKKYGNQQAADQKAISIIADVASKYKQDSLCIQLQLSHLEGYCDSKSDPYKQYVDLKLSGCGNTGVLDGVREYWNQNRQDVHRDAMHLFSGTSFDCASAGCVIGCAFPGTLCSSNAYGVNHITYTSSANHQAILVAHELGHTCGARHCADQDDYIMSAMIGSASKGFSNKSLNAMNYVFSRTSCITEARAPTPQPISTTPTSSPLKNNESMKQLAARISFDMLGITSPQSTENEKRMKSVVETSLSNTLDDTIIENVEFQKYGNVYNANLEIYQTAICVDDCENMISDSLSRIEDKIVNGSFISEIKYEAGIFEVAHLFRNIRVDSDTFTYINPLILELTAAPTPAPTNPIPINPPLSTGDNDKNEPCRTSFNSLVQKLMMMLV